MLTALKSINRPGWWKEKFALFQMQTIAERRVADNCPKANSLPLATNGARVFIDRRRGLQAETAQ